MCVDGQVDCGDPPGSVQHSLERYVVLIKGACGIFRQVSKVLASATGWPYPTGCRNRIHRAATVLALTVFVSSREKTRMRHDAKFSV